MKTRRPLVTPAVLALLVGVVGGLVWGDAPALANTLVVPISGTIDGLPEAVELSGSAEVSSTLVPIEEPGTPRDVIVRLKLVQVSGPGLVTGKEYVAPGENILVRPLTATDVLEVTFPFHPGGSGGHLKARTARVAFTLSFDTATGDITRVTTSSLTEP